MLKMSGTRASRPQNAAEEENQKNNYSFTLFESFLCVLRDLCVKIVFLLLFLGSFAKKQSFIGL